MRYGIFSDVHSNLEAFTAVLDAFSRKKINRYLCIGDIVGYGADPKECIRKTKELNAVIVEGNHDWASAGFMDAAYFNLYAKKAVEWTQTVLSDEEKEFLRSLKLVYQTDDITLVHGTLERPEAFSYIFDTRTAQKTMELSNTQLCFVGHSHVPVVFSSKGGSLSYSFESKVEILPQTRYIINVGSVGQPRDGDPRACFAIYDTETKKIEIERIQYNIKVAQEKIIEAGLPHILATRLAGGK